MKVVLDTNVLVSALLFTGPSNRLVPLWQNGALVLLASAAMVQEYARVLAYPKFHLSEAEIRELLHEDILPFIQAVQVSQIPAVIKEDPSDNQFLACAEAGGAEAIVSGDQHLLNLGSHQGVSIYSIRTILDRLAP